MGKPFISQNITLATGGFTYENGILTPAEAKTIYNLNVPSNVLVSANGLLWIKLNSTKTAAQIGGQMLMELIHLMDLDGFQSILMEILD